MGMLGLGDAPPAPIAFLISNRGAAMGIYFALGLVSGALGKTGAFEVTLDGEPLYSALESAGRVPSVATIAGLLLRAGVEPAPQYAEMLSGVARGGL